MRLKRLLLMLIAWLTIGWVQAQTYTPDASGRIYVNQSVSGGTGSGNSWANAVKELADVLKYAGENAGSVTEIWVAKGTYYPKYDSDGNITEYSFSKVFTVPDGVNIYGGFSGSNETDIDQRNWSTNETILSGEPDDGYVSTLLSASSITCSIDGFAVRCADQNTSQAFSILNSNVTVSNLEMKTIYRGIYSNSSNLTLNNAVIISARDQSIHFSYSYSYNGEFNLTVNNSTLYHGGDAKSASGAVLTIGSSYSTNYRFNVVINNSIITRPKMEGWYNSPLNIGEIMTYNIVINNSYISDMDFSGPTTTLDNGMTTTNTNSFNAFADDYIDPFLKSDYSLHAYSPLLNKGNNSLIPSGVSFDLAHNSRTYGTVDLGAYEYQGNAVEKHVFTFTGDVANQDVVKKRGDSFTTLNYELGGTATGVSMKGDLPKGLIGLLDGNVYTISGSIASNADYGVYTVELTSTGSSEETDSSAITHIIHIAVLPAYSGSGIMYVDQNISVEGDGSSWENALKDLNTALVYANYNNIDAIYVAKGVYYPVSDFNYKFVFNPRSALFNVSANLYGGFDPKNNIKELTDKRDNTLTVLSGNVGDTEDDTDNTYRVMLVMPSSGKLVVDGFTIQDSYYDAAAVAYDSQFDRETSIFSVYNQYVTIFNKSAAVICSTPQNDSTIEFVNNIVADNQVVFSVDRNDDITNRILLAGGGIHAMPNSENGNIYIRDNIITRNSMVGSYLYGAGISSQTSQQTIGSGRTIIDNNIIDANTIEAKYEAYGAGIDVYHAELGATAIKRNNITNNSAIAGDTDVDQVNVSGGGINIYYVRGTDNIVVSYNKINNNRVKAISSNGFIFLGAKGGGISSKIEALYFRRSLNLEETKTEIDNEIEDMYTNVVNNEITGNIAESQQTPATGTEDYYYYNVAAGGGVFFELTDYGMSNQIFNLTNNTIADNKVIAAEDYQTAGAGVCYNRLDEYISDYSHKGTMSNNIIWNNTVESTNSSDSYYSAVVDFVFRSDNPIELYENNLIGSAYKYVRNVDNATSKETKPTISYITYDLDSSNSVDVGSSNDPKFVKTSNSNTSFNNYRLRMNSQAISLGKNQAFVDAGGSLTANSDLYGVDRVIDDYIEAGAYEYDGDPCPYDFSTTDYNGNSISISVIPDDNGIVYVKDYNHDNAPDTPSDTRGYSWEYAHSSLADVLLYAYYHPDCIEEIWVAEGTHLPKYLIPDATVPSGVMTDRDKAFFIVSGIDMFGGFPADATPEKNKDKNSISQRNWEIYETILSGDIDEDGALDDNTYHVVSSVDLEQQTEFNGFVVRDGNADTHSTISYEEVFINRGSGGGISIYTSSKVTDNKCNSRTTSLYIKNTSIVDNWADIEGGGVFINPYANSHIVNSLIARNFAYDGGGVYVSRRMLGEDEVFDFSCPVNLTNVTVAENIARIGAGVSCDALIEINNSIIWGNSIKNSDSSTIDNSIRSYEPISVPFEINSSIIENYNDTDDLSWLATFTDVSAIDPNFKGGNGKDRYHLTDQSVSAVDQGENSFYADAIGSAIPNNEKDLAAGLRIIEEEIDLGAYEYYLDECPFGFSDVYVKDFTVEGAEPGDNSGEDWDNAHPDLAYVLHIARKYPECIKNIYVAEGTYLPKYDMETNELYDAGNIGQFLNNVSFVVPDGITIKGSYPPNATIKGDTPTTDADRNSRKHESILSGNTGDKDDPYDNAFHVMVIPGINSKAGSPIIDGFTIREGFAMVVAGYIRKSSIPDSDNNTFMINNEQGGGIYILGSDAIIKNVVVTENRSFLTGGGIRIAPGNETEDGVTTVNLINVVIDHNIAESGAGISNYDYTLNGDYSTSQLFLTNVTIADNMTLALESTGEGGALFGQATMYNTIIWNNYDNNLSTRYGLSNTIYNSLIQGSNVDGSFNSGYGTNPDGKFYDFDPKFVSSNKKNDKGQYDYTLGESSPAIDKGENDLYIKSTNRIDGFEEDDPDRYMSIPTDKNDTYANDAYFNDREQIKQIDLGAIESPSPCPTTVVINEVTIRISPDADGVVYVKDYDNENTKNSTAGDGSSWESAHGDLADVLMYAYLYPDCIDVIKIAEGTYYPKYDPETGVKYDPTD
ncbi:hypothetical protein LJB98_05735, partial [Bacteroidales bacterium OttesenSCG-928-M11]|nr:hypothetical protein [Bacteroidales bacterium OttesenSCG-928-M11]